jgi:hypothetical protein
MRALFYYEPTALERIKTELKRARYGENKIGGLIHD